jgi:Domain of unknown function (DUF4783)
LHDIIKKNHQQNVKQIIYLVAFFISSPAFGQTEASFFNAIKSGDISSMEPYMEDNIDFCLFEDQQIMTKKSALNKFKTFLNSHKVLSIDVIHKGTAKNKSSLYKVAKITTATDTFRLFVYASGEIGAKTVKEIRIDKF